MNICFVTARFPYPIVKGDTLRAYHQIRELSRTNRVHLIAATDSDVSTPALREMEQYCSGIDIVKISRVQSFATVAMLGLTSKLPLQVLYFVSPALRAIVKRTLRERTFDIVHAMTVRVAPAVLRASHVPVVVDFMDSFGVNVATRRKLVKPLLRRVYDIELSRVTAYERDVAQRTAGGLVIAEIDREAIGNPSVAIIPNGVDTDAFTFHDGARDDATLIFTGNMGYEPNVDAVTWFVAECWPQLIKARPDLRLQIVGARPAPSVLALAQNPGVEVTGLVETMVPYLHKATIAICPIRCGSGMQNKLLEAMASGVPVVTTVFANRAVGGVPGRNISVASDGEQFVDEILKLLHNVDQRTRQARAARTWIERTYGWSRHVADLVKEYERAIATSAERQFRQAG